MRLCGEGPQCTGDSAWLPGSGLQLCLSSPESFKTLLSSGLGCWIVDRVPVDQVGVPGWDSDSVLRSFHPVPGICRFSSSLISSTPRPAPSSKAVLWKACLSWPHSISKQHFLCSPSLSVGPLWCWWFPVGRAGVGHRRPGLNLCPLFPASFATRTSLAQSHPHSCQGRNFQSRAQQLSWRPCWPRLIPGCGCSSLGRKVSGFGGPESSNEY